MFDTTPYKAARQHLQQARQLVFNHLHEKEWPITHHRFQLLIETLDRLIDEHNETEPPNGD